MNYSNSNFSSCSVGQDRRKGFTLIELLVVIAIIALLAAILFPVFARARENARKSSCANNVKQLGLGMAQYTQDYDEMLPAGNSASNGFWGTGWAGGIFAYVKSTQVYRCPNDSTAPGTAPNVNPVSFAYNINLNFNTNGGCGKGPMAALANIPAPARQVLLYETAGTVTDLNNPVEGRSSTGPGMSGFWSNSGGGEKYATGVLGGRVIGSASGYHTTNPRHFDGANYLLIDGHVKFYPSSRVSSGWNPLTTNAPQETGSASSGVCAAGSHAEGSDSRIYSITFSGM